MSILTSFLIMSAMGAESQLPPLWPHSHAAVRTIALQEFAPPEGTGLSAACACTNVTGSKGEAVTFTRASDAWCTKGNENTGIATGDLVNCTTDQIRVMPGGDGTGSLGMARWESRTNVILRSQEFDNAAWIHEFAGATTAVVTANFSAAPDGTTTADRVQFPAVTAGQYTLLKQIVASATNSAALYVKGNGTSGSLPVWLTSSGGGCAQCAYNATTWTRCLSENVATSTVFYIGNDALDCGVAGAQDVLLWQGDVQAAATMGPPITTAGTAATRAAETIQILSPSFAVAGCAAATITNPTTSSLPQKFMVVSNVNQTAYGAFGDTTNAMWMYDGTNSPTSGNGTMSNASPVRMRWQWATGTSLMSAAASTGATIAPGAFDGIMYSGGALDLGGFTTGSNYQINGVIKFVQLDTNPAGCQ